MWQRPLLAERVSVTSIEAASCVDCHVAAFFVATRVPRYFDFTPQSYGPYFWPRASWILVHVLGGLVAAVIGPMQFWQRIRQRHVRIHRVAGRVYLGIAVGGTAGLLLAVTSKVTLTYAAGLAGLAIAWLTTAGLAFAAVRNGSIDQHRQWMIRSYVVTLAFVSFRLAEDLLGYLGIGTQVDRLTVMSWACWTVPLFATEVAFHTKAIFRPR